MKKEEMLNKIPLYTNTIRERYFVYKRGTNERLNIPRHQGDFPGFPTERGCNNVLKTRLGSIIRYKLMDEYKMNWNDPNLEQMTDDLTTQLLPEFEIRKVVFKF